MNRQQRQKALASRAKSRNQLLAAIVLDVHGSLATDADVLTIGQRLGLTFEEAQTRCEELKGSGFVHSVCAKEDRPSIVCRLAHAGLIEGERLLQPWHVQLWREHKHAIVTGAFAVIASILGALVGGFVGGVVAILTR